ncbi:MAG: 23S rRNA (cytidine(2498)-2'-O)-methyltransferase RlmM [Gammaproteobacteria bacterium]|nr:23S rRNA (cytidine(2498)-2'-O)-methyltransferase RlmM [Gammaproteobacteria bacterium]
MSPVTSPRTVLAYCRAGYENELLAELTAPAVTGDEPLITGAGAGFALAVAPDAAVANRLYRALTGDWPVFARQLLLVTEPLRDLPARARLSPILATAIDLAPGYQGVWLEHADTEDGKALAPLCRRLTPLLERALTEANHLHPERVALPRLHVFFPDTATAYLAAAEPKRTAPWPLGIPRLHAPRAAPSRSVLKLEEAIVTFLTSDERIRLLRPGLRAVDLGAAPGGWSWLLAQNGLRVTAVDHGRLAPIVTADGLVEHVRADAYTYKPPRPIDWLVCDIVDKPRRSAACIARWIRNGWCRHAIFNLKLPGKDRGTLLARCREEIEAALPPRATLHFRQLYHDRDEVTGCFRGRD